MGFGKTKQEQFSNWKPGGGGGDDWFKPDIPKTGEVKYHLRLVPPLEGESQPIVSSLMHYWANYPDRPPQGVEPGVSPSDSSLPEELKGKDLARRISYELRDFFEKDSPQNSVVRALGTTTRGYANVVVRKTPQGDIPEKEQKVQTWSLPYKALENLLSLYRDYSTPTEANGNSAPIDDIEEGRDLILKIRRTPMVEMTFSVYMVPSPLAEDVETLASTATPLFKRAHQRVLTEEQCREWVKAVAGDFYDEIIAAYQEVSGETLEENVLEEESLGEIV